MREMLESFRLPGESQQIERVTDTFAAKFFASNPGNYVVVIHPTLTRLAAEIKTQDAVHILAFAIIMLNTDLHNPQVRVCLKRYLLRRQTDSRL